ncbi:GNAT family N-acetyltransferase [Caenispirillum salinarum]|uniref:GNAT family N-acetyltransferase n=1 Tax=Caenispirillum salinarum TaxID=859058 RepID=UPI00384C4DAE
MGDPVLPADGLCLRRSRPDDIPFIRYAEAAPENARFVGQWTEPEHQECMIDADCRHMVIEDRASGADGGNDPRVGYVLLQGLRDENGSLLLRRFVVARKGRGVGRRVLAAILRHAFDDIGCHRLWLDVREDNVRAIDLYRRFGFVVEGRERENVRLDDTYLSTLRMSLLDREYRGAAPAHGPAPPYA